MKKVSKCCNKMRASRPRSDNNGIVEGDEICDGTPIDCDELDSTYVSGIAACNSTCDGYVLDNCTAGNGGDGW